MKLETTEALADFTAKKVKSSKLSIPEIAELSGISTKSVDHAYSKGQSKNPGRNGTRAKVLKTLGYEVSTVFIINKVQKK